MHVRKTVATVAALAVFVGAPLAAQHERHAMPEGHGEHTMDHAAMLDHLGEVLVIDASVREAIAGDIEAITIASQQLSELQQRAEGASDTELELIHADMETAQKQLHEHHDAVAAKLTPEQGEKFTNLLHEHLMKLHRPNSDHEASHARRHR